MLAANGASGCRRDGRLTSTDAARPEFFAHMDAANVDLKGFTGPSTHDVCAAELEPVLDTLRYLKHETDVWFELTTLLIPGLNDDDDSLDAALG